MKYFQKTPNKIFYTTLQKPSGRIINKAARILHKGGMIIYPTNTLYGFGSALNNEATIKRLYELKKREGRKPYSILINHIDQASQICGGLSKLEQKIFHKLMPGKITLLLKLKKQIDITGLDGLDKIGFRYSSDNLCHRLITAAGMSITSSSVNISKRHNLSDVDQIAEQFAEHVDMIIDAGPVQSLKGSTILDTTTDPLSVVREGEILSEEIEKILDMPVKNLCERRFVITVICSGNICRSPMAHGILQNMIENSNYRANVEINSAGTLGLPPSKASNESIKIAEKHGVNIANHLSTPVDRYIIDRANLVLCMELYHQKFLSEKYPEYRDKIHLLKQWKIEQERAESDIADPIGMSEAFYREIYDEIFRESTRIWPFLAIEIDRYLKNKK